MSHHSPKMHEWMSKLEDWGKLVRRDIVALEEAVNRCERRGGSPTEWGKPKGDPGSPPPPPPPPNLD